MRSCDTPFFRDLPLALVRHFRLGPPGEKEVAGNVPRGFFPPLHAPRCPDSLFLKGTPPFGDWIVFPSARTGLITSQVSPFIYLCYLSMLDQRPSDPFPLCAVPPQDRGTHSPGYFPPFASMLQFCPLQWKSTLGRDLSLPPSPVGDKTSWFQCPTLIILLSV